MAVGRIDLVAAAFGLFNVLRLASYFPQLVAVARDQNGATATEPCMTTSLVTA